MNKEHLEHEFDREFLSVKDNWKALCPFHDEKTPSFLVHQDSYIGNCFGCGESGYIEVLLSKYQNISAKEARRRLDINVIDRATIKEKVTERQKTFPESWLAPWKAEIHKSILARGISFDLLRAVGTRYDPSLKRQVFPHRNGEGDLIGAAGRSTDGREPKWYFYWSYSRGETLYTPFGRGYGRLFVVEGIFDVLRLKEAGIKGDLAATLGTKIGKGQIREIKEYDEVVIGFDGDQAGQEAAERLHKRIRRSCKTSLVVWPKGKDPADCSLKEVREHLDFKSYGYVLWKALQRTDTSS